MPNLRAHVVTLCATRDLAQQEQPGIAAVLASARGGWPSAVLGAVAPDARQLTGEPRAATHAYRRRDLASVPRAVDCWLAQRPDARRLLAEATATADTAFVVGYVTHLCLDAWIDLRQAGRGPALGDGQPDPSSERPPEAGGLCRAKAFARAWVESLHAVTISTDDQVSSEALRRASVPAGFPEEAIHQLGERVPPMLATTDPWTIYCARRGIAEDDAAMAALRSQWEAEQAALPPVRLRRIAERDRVLAAVTSYTLATLVSHWGQRSHP